VEITPKLQVASRDAKKLKSMEKGLSTTR
jgi:hypothetical protein